MNQGFVEFIFPYFTYLCGTLGTPLSIFDFNNDTCNIFSHSSSILIGQFKRKSLESYEKDVEELSKIHQKRYQVATDNAAIPKVIVVQCFGVTH